MTKEYKIYKKLPDNKDKDTGYKFVAYEEKSIWGIKSGEYMCFSKKYYKVKEIEEEIPDLTDWY